MAPSPPFGKKVGVPQGGVSKLNNQRNIFFAWIDGGVLTLQKIHRI
jgi:hypothetical protein